MDLGLPCVPTAQDLLRLSEQASQATPTAWALAYLGIGYPGTRQELFLDLPIGMRDAHLMAVRQRHFPGELRAEPICANCDATFEISLTSQEIGFGMLPEPLAGFQEVEIAGRVIRVRPVTSVDLLAVERISDPEIAANRLSERVTEKPSNVSASDLDAALECVDPTADIWITVACPECGKETKMAFDPVAYIAHEVRQAAHRLMSEVAEIARVFHWSEQDILALPDARRRFYLAEAMV